MAVSCKHNGIIDLLTALSKAVNRTTTHYNQTQGSVVQDMHNDSTMEFFCLFLSLLLALKTRTAHSAPDFSRKCSVFVINNCFFRRKSNCWPGYFLAMKDLERKFLRDIEHPQIFFVHPAFQTAGATHPERPESGSWTFYSQNRTRYSQSIQ